MTRTTSVSTPVLLIAVFFLVFACTTAFADQQIRHKLVIQVSSNDVQTQTVAMNNAVNLQKELGIDNIDIEIVAYGPGLSMLMSKNPDAARVSSLAMQNITFSACGNTMHAIEAKTGNPVQLADGVGVVKAGVLRIMELQEQGYNYIRP